MQNYMARLLKNFPVIWDEEEEWVETYKSGTHISSLVKWAFHEVSGERERSPGIQIATARLPSCALRLQESG